MDIWGIAGCELHREEIVSHLVKNRDMITDALRLDGGWISKVTGGLMHLVPDSVMRLGAGRLLDLAIADVRGEARPARVKAVPSPRRGFFTYIPSRQSRFITSEQFQKDIKLLLSKVPHDITAIAGIARSGLSVATMLSMYLHLPMLTIRQTLNDVVDTGNGWRLGGSRHVDPKRSKVLIVDDTVMTGNSIKQVRTIVAKEFDDYLFASVYVNPAASQKPDIWAVDLPWPHILEWNVFNSILSASLALDFDGILCRDCPAGSDDDGDKYLEFIRTATPLYLPRRSNVGLIVTARIEKYREETEAWLSRHDVKYSQLIMHPATSLRDRMRDDIAAYKAEAFRNWLSVYMHGLQPRIFFESEDGQARRIGELTKSDESLVICPATAGVY
jgi:adenine/guanine phosphoribosyltransferase-like PRPP-binding protein